MPNDNESTKWLYEQLTKKGYNVGKDQAEFDNLMATNADSRKWAYETAQKSGLNVGKDIDEFTSLVAPAPAVQPQAQEQGNPVSSPAPAQQTAWEPSWQEKAAALRQLDRMSRRVDAVAADTKERIGNMVEYGQRSLGFNTMESKPVFNPGTGKVEKTYLTPTGSRTTDKSAAEKSTRQVRQAVEDAKVTVDKQLKAAEAEQERLNKLMEARKREIDKEKGERPLFARVLNSLAENSPNKVRANMPADTNQRYRSDEQFMQLEAAARKNNLALQTLRDKKNGKMNNFWHSVGTTLMNGYSLTGGASDMYDASALMSAKYRLDEINRKREAGKPLTDEEKASEAVLRNAVINEQVQGMYGGEYGAWSRAGAMTATSIDLMKDIMLTPGAAGFSKAVASKTAGALSKGVAKVAGEKVARNIITRGLLKGTGILVGAHAGGALVTNVAGIGHTLGETGKELSGRVAVDDNGGYKLEDQKDLLHAFAEAERRQIGENGSEMFGEFIPGAGKLVTKGLEKMGLSKVSNALTRIGNKEWFKQYSALLAAGGYSGLPGEAIEEYEGMLFDAITGNAKETWEQVKDPRTHIDIWLGCATMGALMGSAPVVMQGYQTAQYYRYKHKTDVADKVAAFRITPERWEPIREKIDETENGQMADVVMDIINDGDMEHEEKKAALDYVRSLQNMRGYNIAEANNAGEEKDPEKQEANESYKGGHEAAAVLSSGVDGKQTEDEVAEAQADVDAISIRMQEADEGIEDAFGADGAMVEYVKASLNEDPWKFIGENELTEDQRDAVLYFINAKAALDGVMDASNEAADMKRIEVKQSVKKRTHKDGGVIVPATMKVDYRPVYVVKDDVVMFPDGSGVDAANSSESVVVMDAQTGEYEFTSPDQIFNVSEAVDPQEELDAAMAAIEQERIGVFGENVPEEVGEAGSEGEVGEVGDVSETGNNGGEIIPENGNIGADNIPVGTEAQQTALSRIPVNEQGEPMFESVDRDTAWDGLVEAVGGEADASEIAMAQIQQASAELEKLKKKPPMKKTPKLSGSPMAMAQAKREAAEQYQEELDAYNQQVADTQSRLDAWNGIVGVYNQRRADASVRQEAEARRLAAERAAAEKAEQEARAEAERQEREALEGVPEWHLDTPENARKRGARRYQGQLFERQGALVEGLSDPSDISDPSSGVGESYPSDKKQGAVIGKEVEVKFSQKDLPKGRVAVIEAERLQPSHVQGQRNPMFFIEEAQPKNRAEVVSTTAARDMAEGIRPQEITGSATAYTGAPTVNARGEVIQGNNRSDALRYLWKNELPEQQQAYKQYLLDHAEQFGLDGDAVGAMQHPVLVNMLDVDDAEAIRLGQLTAQDTESGGVERIKPKNVAQKLGENMRTFANRLLSSADEEATFGQLVDKNGEDVLKWMTQTGAISNTQYQSAFDSNGNLTAEAKNDLQKVLYQSVFKGGSQQLEEMFDKLPAKAQRAILATAFRDMDSPLAGRMLPEIQSTIIAYHALMQDSAFASAKNMEEVLRAVDDFKRQTLLDDRLEQYMPADNFSNFALHLAGMYKAGDMSQTTIASYFNQMYDLAQGKKEATLFDEADTTKHPLAEVIKQVLGIDYKPAKNGNNNVADGGNALAVGNQDVQVGEFRNGELPASGEQTEGGAEPAKRGGGTAGDSGRSGDRPTRGGSEEAAAQEKLSKEEASDIIAKMEMSAENDPQITLSPESWQQSFGLRNAIETPIGEVKMGEGQYQKLIDKKRSSEFGMVVQTLQDPDVVFIEPSEAKEGQETERDFSYVFVKTFIRDGKKLKYYTSVSVFKDGMEVSVSSHIASKTAIMKKLQGMDRAYTKESLLPNSSEWHLAEHPTDVPDLLPTQGKSDAIFESKLQTAAFQPHGLASKSKDSEKSIAVQGYGDKNTENGASPTFRDWRLFRNNEAGGDAVVAVVGNPKDGYLARYYTSKEDYEGQFALGERILSAKELVDNIKEGKFSDVEGEKTLQASIDAAASDVNTTPTPAQAEAGNYKKGHVTIGDFDITIENPAGSVRKGVDANGKEWQTTMANTYGYFKGTEGVDGDHIDVFLHTDMDQWNGRKVYVVDQTNRDGSFDEHKVMLGFNDKDEAMSAYLANYDATWAETHPGLRISETNIEDFNKWIESSHRKTKPFAEYKGVKKETTGSSARASKLDGNVMAPSSDEAALRNALVDLLRESGIEVITDDAEAQRVLEMADGADVRMQASLDGLRKASGFIQSFLEGKLKQKGVRIDIPERANRLAERAIGHAINSHRINGNELTHARNRHGLNGTANNVNSIPLRDEDFALMPYIMFSPTRVVKGSTATNGTESVRYEKDLSNGIVIVVEREGRFDVEDMENITMWAQKKPATNVTVAQGASHSTSETIVISEADAAKIRKDAEDAIRNDAKVREHASFFRTSNGEAYGFTVGGKIYIDPEIASAETPIHEYAHLWASALREGNPEEWGHIVGLMKDTPVWEEVKQQYPELESDDELADEVIARFSGKRGAERLREEQRKAAEGDGNVFDKASAVSAIERVKQALRRFWKAVADFLHIHYTSAEEVADRVLKDMLDGVKPENVGKDAAVSDFAKRNGLKDSSVRKYAQSMKSGQLGGASWAFKDMKRDVRLANAGISLGEFVKIWKPIQTELYSRFGNIDTLREEHVQRELEERGAMGAARKRAEQEAENERKRLQEFELMSDEEMDAAYFTALESGDEARMRDIVNEAARRNGYVSEDEFRMAHRAPTYDAEGYDKSMTDIAANKDEIRDSLNEQLNMNRDKNREESAEAISNALSAIDRGKNPMVTVYRAVPKSLKEGKIRNGDWVSLSRSYVEQHGNHALDGDFRVMEERVPAENVFWDGNDINEWGYDDRSDYKYRNTRNNRKLNDLVTRDDAGNVILPSKRFNSRKKDVRYQIVGEKGASSMDKAEEATMRMDNLNVAREMEASNKDAKSIRMATGWERGADGKWRYEIADFDDAALRSVLKEDAVRRNRLDKQLRELTFRKYELEDEVYPDKYFDEFSDEEREEWDKNHEKEEGELESLSREIGRLKGLIKNYNIYTDLESVVGKDVELFNYYPELRSVSVHITEDMDADTGGTYYNAFGGVIKLNRNALFDKTILIHEVQHAIQHIEGFSTGESSSSSEYNRVAGEVEARNIQRRMSMSDEDRKNKLLADTEDVSRKDQIILRDAFVDRQDSRAAEENNIEAVNARFNEELDAFNDNKHHGLLHLGSPMGKLRACGINVKEITLSPSVLYKHLKKHGLTTNDLKGLAKEIQNPILVYKHGKNSPNMVVVTELDVKGGKLSASFVLDNAGNVVEVSNISSIHSKDAGKELKRLYNMGEEDLRKSLRWVDKEKALGWIAPSSYENSGMQDKQEPFDVAKVMKDFENPTIEVDKKGASSDEASSEAESSRVRELSEKLHTPIRIISEQAEIDAFPSRRQREAKGWWSAKDDEIVVVLSNHANVADVENTVVHEVVGHEGLRALVGEERFGAFLGEVYGHASDAIREAVDSKTDEMVGAEADRLRVRMAQAHEHAGEDANAHYYADMAQARLDAEKQRETFRREAMEEYMADMAGRIGDSGFEKMSRDELTLWGKIKAKVQSFLDKFLRGLGISRSIRLNDKDLAYILYKSWKNLRGGGVFADAEDAVMRRKTGWDDATMPREMSTREVKDRVEKLFDDAVNGDLKGKPVTIGTLSKEGKAYLERLSGMEMKPRVDFVMNPSDMAHINKRHFGENEKDGRNIPLTKEDIRNIVDVLTHPDNIVFAKERYGEMRKMFFFSKKTNDGTYRLLEIYAGKKGNLTSKSFLKNKEGVSQRALLLYESPTLTSVTDGATLLSGEKGVSQRAMDLEKSLLLTSETYSGATLSDAKVPKMFDNPSISDEETSQIRFRDGGMGLEETITKMKVEASQANADNWQAKQDAMRAIGGNLNKLRQAMARQREYDLSTVKSITDLAKVLLENGLLDDLSKYETKRILGTIDNVIGKQDVSKYVQNVMDIMVDNQLRMGVNALGRLLSIRGKRVDARGIEVQGELDPEGQAIAQVVRKSTSLPKEDIDNRIADALDRMGSADQALADEAAIEYAGLLIARQYVEDITESKAEEKGLRDSLKEAKADKDAGRMSGEAYKEYVASTEDAIRQNKIERAEAYHALAQQIGGVLNESVERAKAWREAEKKRVEEIHHNANSDMEGRPTDEHHKDSRMQKLVNNSGVRFLLAPLATFDQMLRMFGKKNARGEGYLWNRYMRGWVSATEKEYTGYRDALKVLDAKVSEIYGKKMSWGDLFTIDRKLPKASVRFFDGGEMKDHELTQGNLLYIYMTDKMSDGRMKLRRMGITEENIEEIKDFLDPKFIELADWMQEEFLVGKRNEYNEVHKRMFGASMAAIENYFPLKILANARLENVDVADDTADTALPATSTGSIIKRKRNNLALDVTGANAFSVILGHLQQMERWAAFAEFNRDLNTLLSYKRFRNQVMNMTSVYGAGKTLWNNFRNVCSMAAGAYRPPIAALDKSAVNIAKGVTAAKVSFRLFTALKQFLSMPAYLSDSNPVYLAANIANPVGAWKWAMQNLPLFDKRWSSRMAGDPRLMKSEMDWKMWQNRVAEIASRIGMSPNAFVDALTVSIGAHSMYQTRLVKYKRQGYDAEVAERKAKQDATILFNQTQQSSESAFLSTMQVDRSWLSVLFTVFRNSSMSYTRQLYDSIRNLGHYLTPGYKGLTEEFMAKQMIREGIDPEKASTNAKREYRRGIIRDIVRVAVFGFIMQLAWNLGAYLPYLLFGDDDDEKDKMLDDIINHTMFGSIEGLTGGDVLSAAGQMWANGEGNPQYLAKDMPLASDVLSILKKLDKDKVAAMNDVINLLVQSGIGVNPQSITDAVVAIMDYCGDDAQTSRECALLIARIANCPQSQLDKIYLDELGVDGEEASKMTPSEIAERYARYKVRRGAPLTGWAYGDEQREKLMEKYRKPVITKAKEKLTNATDAQASPNMSHWMEEYNATKERVSAINKLEEDDEDKYYEQLDALEATPEYERYLIIPNRSLGFLSAVRQ